MIKKRNILLIFATVIAAAMTGCSPGYYHKQADDVAAKIIEQGQKDALGRTEPFTIEKASDTLRKRLIANQTLPVCCDASIDTDKLKPIEHWPEKPKDKAKDKENSDKPQPNSFEREVSKEPLKITLNDALQIGAYNSRDYQTRKESIFKSALDLDMAADEFRFTYAGLLESLFSFNESSGTEITNISQGAEAGVTKKLKTGTSLASRLVFDLATLLSQDGASSKGIYFDASITIPLLSGSGKHIVTEPLTQATRNVLYSIYSFDRYKRTFAVQIASSYLSAIQNKDSVRNAYDNYMKLKASAERARAMAEDGDRMSGVEVDQAKQNEFSARDRWISARRTYGRGLDDLKMALGLPTDALIDIDENELTKLAGQVAGISGKAKSEEKKENGDSETKAISDLLDYREGGGGPFELTEAKAVEIAFANRLDLRTAQGDVFDAQRGVVVAADGLRAGLTLTGGVSAGGRRSIGSATSDDAQLRFDQGSYTAALSLDLPWEKTSERNTYRKSLIDLDQSVRSLQELEDSIKLQVRDALRKLIRNRESYAIQVQAVKLAAGRVESTNLLLELGRVEIRDLLEAQAALIDAQNALTLALVNYRIAELELQRDMGVLNVDEKGSWREFEPAKNE